MERNSKRSLHRHNTLLILLSGAFLFCACNGKVDIAEEPKGEDVVSPKWISEIIEYKPAPGQFVNTGIGDQKAAKSIVGKFGEVTLGGFGGYIIFKFDHNVKNIDGVDFVIHGNAFAGSSEPGAVMVLSKGTWYELKGSEYEKSEPYEITYHKPKNDNDDIFWTDNKGGEGSIRHLPIHSNSYYPSFLSGDKLTFSGHKAPSNNRLDEEQDKWVLDAFDWGYVDNFSADYKDIVGGDPDTKNSNKFDISNAIDKDGKKVVLTEIEAIKVYNCTHSQSGAIGECSTEIIGAISLSIK